MASDVLLAGLVAGLAALALAVTFLGVLSARVQRQDRRHDDPDPHVERLARLVDETRERRDETRARLEAVRQALHEGLRH